MQALSRALCLLFCSLAFFHYTCSASLLAGHRRGSFGRALGSSTSGNAMQDDAAGNNAMTQSSSHELGGAGSGSSASSHSGDGHAHQYETLVFLFISILVGTVILHLMTHPWLHNLQFTVVLFVLGIFFAMLAESGWVEDNMLWRSYHSWVAIDPHLLLFTILPPLLCGDAMTIDTHVAKGCIYQCLLLAGPGVVLGSFSTALVVHYVLPYGWNFATSLTVGSILAATDPVAVVGLLKELGASPVLTMLIQGESLLNDGTAIVLFTIAYDITSGETYNVTEVFVFLLKQTLGAGCVGALVGLVAYFWIRSLNDKLGHHNPMIQVILTFGCAYWSWILGEGVFHISGVISTVSAAIVLAHFMWPVVLNRDAMLEIWHVVETIGNSLVFFLAGAMTGKAMFEIDFVDVFWAMFVYVACMAIRLIMNFMMFPILRRLGRPVTWKDLLVMSWGGLRGMVGLALAILVKKECAAGHLSKADGDRILFLVGSIAMLTLVVNATTSPALCNKLGILQPPEGRKVVVANVIKDAEAHMNHMIETLFNSRRDLHGCDAGLVKELADNLMNSVKEHGQGHGHGHGHSNGHSHGHSNGHAKPTKPGGRRGGSAGGSAGIPPEVTQLFTDFEDARLALLNTHDPAPVFAYGKHLTKMRGILTFKPINHEALAAVRGAFLDTVMVNYWEQLQEGRFTGLKEPNLLFESVKLAKERCRVSLCDWDLLDKDIQFAFNSSSEVNTTVARPSVVNGQIYEGRASLMSCKSGISEFADLEAESRVKSMRSSIGEVVTEGYGNIVKRWRKHLHRRRVVENFNTQLSGIQVIHAFIEAHSQTQVQTGQVNFSNLDDKDTPPEEIFVVIESQIQILRAATKRAQIARHVQRGVTTMWQVRRLADELRDFLLSLHEHGVLQTREAEELLHPLSDGYRRLERERKQYFRNLQKKSEKKGKRNFEEDPMSETEAAKLVQRAFRKWHNKKMFSAITALIRTQKTLNLANNADSSQGLKDIYGSEDGSDDGASQYNSVSRQITQVSEGIPTKRLSDVMPNHNEVTGATEKKTSWFNGILPAIVSGTSTTKAPPASETAPMTAWNLGAKKI